MIYVKIILPPLSSYTILKFPNKKVNKFKQWVSIDYGFVTILVTNEEGLQIKTVNN